MLSQLTAIRQEFVRPELIAALSNKLFKVTTIIKPFQFMTAAVPAPPREQSGRNEEIIFPSSEKLNYFRLNRESLVLGLKTVARNLDANPGVVEEYVATLESAIYDCNNEEVLLHLFEIIRAITTSPLENEYGLKRICLKPRQKTRIINKMIRKTYHEYNKQQQTFEELSRKLYAHMADYMRNEPLYQLDCVQDVLDISLLLLRLKE